MKPFLESTKHLAKNKSFETILEKFFPFATPMTRAVAGVQTNKCMLGEIKQTAKAKHWKYLNLLLELKTAQSKNMTMGPTDNNSSHLDHTK